MYKIKNLTTQKLRLKVNRITVRLASGEEKIIDTDTQKGMQRFLDVIKIEKKEQIEIKKINGDD